MSAAIPRGAIKRFREHLNSLPGPLHRNGPFHQQRRPYGDYLYAQDRDKFMVELAEWLTTAMTPDAPKAGLKQEEKRELIAKHLGYSRCVGGCQPKGEKEPRYWRTPSGREVRVIPDFFADLNEIHKAERVAILAPFDTPENDTIEGSERLSEQLDRFEKELCQRAFGLGRQWHASAAQRAEAFGKALSLW